jgi:hypothetical protein
MTYVAALLVSLAQLLRFVLASTEGARLIWQVCRAPVKWPW